MCHACGEKAVSGWAVPNQINQFRERARGLASANRSGVDASMVHRVPMDPTEIIRTLSITCKARALVMKDGCKPVTASIGHRQESGGEQHCGF
jgi:hypothetical protein